MRAKKLRNRIWRFAGDDEIEIAHDFPAAAKTSSHAYLRGIVVRGQIASQLFRFSSDFAKLKGAGVLRAISNGVANFGLSRFAKARQFRYPARFTRCL